MADLDTLRPEVREAVVAIDGGNGVFVNSDDGIGSVKWKVVRAELMQLAKENADLLSTIDLDEQVWVQRDETMHRWIERARNAEAELAALKARIAEAPIGMVMGGAEGIQDNTDSYRVDVPIGWESSLADKRVRLVVEE